MSGRIVATVAVALALCSCASGLRLDAGSPVLRPSTSAFSPCTRAQCKRCPPGASAGLERRVRGGSGPSRWLASCGGIGASATIVGLSNLFGLVFTLTTGSQKATDLVGSGCFAVSALSTFIIGGQAGDARALASTSLISVWSIRLASFLFYRIMNTKTDNRLSNVFATTTGTVGFWIFSFLWGFLVLLPHSMQTFAKQSVPLGAVGYTSIALGSLGFLCEAVADWQKWEFKNSARSKDKWCSEGLWRYSRHPNYAGEMTVWWSLFVLAVPSLTQDPGVEPSLRFALSLFGSNWRVLLALVSPCFITYLIRFVSGINLAEERNDARFGNLPAYQEYKETTPLLFPRIFR
mmetsp:Transcript_23887/g.58984  ORF Transcript_23887/g.58984 Transcript_23887/m.58984 type:complete len:349 (+) Transcript_23887:16-1062(+)